MTFQGPIERRRKGGVSKIWDHGGLRGECKGRWGVVVKEDGEYKWEKMKDQKNEDLQMSQPFSHMNDQLPLLESAALHAGLACSFFTADGSVWCS